jgi:hypothetical protein
MNKERLVKDLNMCIAGINKYATDTIWVHDTEFPERPETVVECLQEIKENILITKDPTLNDVMTYAYANDWKEAGLNPGIMLGINHALDFFRNRVQ